MFSMFEQQECCESIVYEVYKQASSKTHYGISSISWRQLWLIGWFNFNVFFLYFPEFNQIESNFILHWRFFKKTLKVPIA